MLADPVSCASQVLRAQPSSWAVGRRAPRAAGPRSEGERGRFPARLWASRGLLPVGDPSPLSFPSGETTGRALPSRPSVGGQGLRFPEASLPFPPPPHAVVDKWTLGSGGLEFRGKGTHAGQGPWRVHHAEPATSGHLSTTAHCSDGDPVPLWGEAPHLLTGSLPSQLDPQLDQPWSRLLHLPSETRPSVLSQPHVSTRGVQGVWQTRQ